MAIILSNLNRFYKKNSLEDSLVNLHKSHQNSTTPCIPVCCHTTLLNINVEKGATGDKLQRSVATFS